MQPRLNHTLKSMDRLAHRKQAYLSAHTTLPTERKPPVWWMGLGRSGRSSQTAVIIGQAKAKVADSVAEIMKWSQKSTIVDRRLPLQNKLEELYGLVSVFDPKYFYSLDAFKERYIKNRDDMT